jgi:Tol biopolymer transport system component
MKHRRLFFAPLVLGAAMLGCTLVPGGAAVPVPTETQPVAQQLESTQPPVAPTEALPTETTQPTAAVQPTASPLPATAPAPVNDGPIVLAKMSTDPSQPSTLRVVDPVTGLTQSTFQAPGLTMGPPPLIGGSAVFFTDFSSTGVHRLAFDGQAQILTFMTADGRPFDGTFLPSPDGSRIVWSDVLSEDASGTHVQLIIANVDGSGQKVLIDENRPHPTRPEPVRWSNDGKSLYYTNVPYGIGGYILFFGGQDLKKLDIASGKSTQILPPDCMCALALSPDEAWVASVHRPEGDHLDVYVTSTGGGNPVKGSLPANYEQAGKIVWSPDSQSLLVTAALGDPDNESFTVVLFHAADMSSKVLIQDDPHNLETALWPSAGVVWLNDKDDNAWRMDPSTGNLTQSSSGESVLGGAR